MKKLLLPYIISIICISCKNGSSQASIDNDLSKRDSIQIALYNDSIKRELIFEALGDTVFGDICYGASYNSTLAFRLTLFVSGVYMSNTSIVIQYKQEIFLHVNQIS